MQYALRSLQSTVYEEDEKAANLLFKTKVGLCVTPV